VVEAYSSNPENTSSLHKCELEWNWTAARSISALQALLELLARAKERRFLETVVVPGVDWRRIKANQRFESPPVEPEIA